VLVVKIQAIDGYPKNWNARCFASCGLHAAIGCCPKLLKGEFSARHRTASGRSWPFRADFGRCGGGKAIRTKCSNGLILLMSVNLSQPRRFCRLSRERGCSRDSHTSHANRSPFAISSRFNKSAADLSENTFAAVREFGFRERRSNTGSSQSRTQTRTNYRVSNPCFGAVEGVDVQTYTYAFCRCGRLQAFRVLNPIKVSDISWFKSDGSVH